MKTAMVISPHADDATLFCGGTLAKLAQEGWRVILVRVTDDRYDSVGLSVDETIRRNADELGVAAGLLGVAEVIDLGFRTDCLADTSETELRERFVYLLRRHRPHTVLSFDPFQQYEDNQDHVRVAQAVAEAFWVSCFDKHHPEHLAEGLEPFTPAERWYFARTLPAANHVVDVTPYLERKIAAGLCHETMMRNVANQFRLQLRTAGRRVPLVDAAVAGDLLPVVEIVLGGQARAVAAGAGLPEGTFAEAFRRERFGGLDDLFDELGEDLPE
jgi:LmbE family N-acetylglucosaminyl deacetylase